MPDNLDRPRKKSRHVSLGLVAFVAGSLAACGPTDYRRCVDRDGRVVDDEPGETQPARGAGGSWGGYSGAYYGPYRWYYGGRGLRVGESRPFEVRRLKTRRRPRGGGCTAPER